VDVIQEAIAALPPPAKSNAARWRQYEDAKRQLGKLAATCAEYEQICKAIARRYGV